MPRSAGTSSAWDRSATLPVESNITPTCSRWFRRLYDGTTRLRYGTTTAYESASWPRRPPGDCPCGGYRFAAMIYHVQAFSWRAATQARPAIRQSTASPPGATGQIMLFQQDGQYEPCVRGSALGCRTSRGCSPESTAPIAGRCLPLQPERGGRGCDCHGACRPNARVKVRSSRKLQQLVECLPDAPGNGIPPITDTYDVVWGGQG
jgi:hypothetical protein